jgi:glycosyltransferase involved in cell wall biosynthesis
MKLAILGSRGIPSKYGGFETFAEEISVLLVKTGVEVTVQCDKRSNDKDEYRGVNLFYSKVTKSANPLRYYFEGIRWAVKNCDIILVLGSGGAIFYFLNILKRRVIITNTDGLEFRRDKWSFPIKVYWRISEAFSILFSDILIADSIGIRDYLLTRYRISTRKVRVIEYGAYENGNKNFQAIQKYSLSHRGYYLVVCRLEPENNIEMVIDGYIKSGSALPLVVVGNILKTRYVKRLLKKYNSERVRYIGGIYDKVELSSLRYSCKAYIHGHSVGGTNPSLLEAMGSMNIILVHENIFNREVAGNDQFYFENSDECAAGISIIEKMSEQEIEEHGRASLKRIHDYYNWEMILQKYINLFSNLKLTKPSE